MCLHAIEHAELVPFDYLLVHAAYPGLGDTKVICLLRVIHQCVPFSLSSSSLRRLIMGSAVSILDSHYSDSSSTDSTNSSTTGKASYTSTDTAKANMARHPTYIPIPSPYFASISITPSPSHRLEDPFASPLISPALTFYTAPSSPIPSPMAEETVLFQLTSVEVSQPSVSGSGLQMSLPAAQPYQPMSLMSPRYSPATTSPHPLANSIEPDPPLHSPMADTDDTFPDVPDIEMALDDEGMEGLNPLEKIYLYSISKATYHRIFICRDLPNLLDLLTPQEAVEYVLPLLHILSKDQGKRCVTHDSSRLTSFPQRKASGKRLHQVSLR